MAEKLFSEDEITALSAEIRAKTKAAMAEPGAKAPVVFTNGLLDAIMSAIVTGTGAAARKAQRALAPLQETIRGLVGRMDAHDVKSDSQERRLSRHAAHLAELERKMQSVLRKVGGE